MGLTVHYSLKTTPKKGTKLTLEDARRMVKSMRDICMDLPFADVGEIMELSSRDIKRILARRGQNDLTEAEETQLWFVSGAGKLAFAPWNKKMFMSVEPISIIGFTAWPGEGCESSDFGLCVYPDSIEMEYFPKSDSRFQLVTKKGGCTTYHSQLDWKKWDRHCNKTFGEYRSPGDFVETRTVPTKLSAWSWSSSCKTQYASDPNCGGLPNFLRCHITLITALDRMAKIAGLKVEINDEGHYGPAKYSDDYEDAANAGRKATYVWHEATYSPSVLAKQLGDYNGMMAALFGTLKDAMSAGGGDMDVVSPIQEFSNFEELEFKGQQSKNVEGFLKALAPKVKA